MPPTLLITFKYLQTAFNNAALSWSRHPLTPVLVEIRDMLTSFLQTLIVMNQIPTGDQLRHVSKIEKTPQRQSTNRASSVPAARTQTPTTTLPMYIGGSIPPIPGKLVCRIQKGNFIDMAELFFANLEIANATDEDHSKVNGHKLQQVTNIMNWIQYFSTCIAVVSRTEPECAVNLVAYLNIIIKGQRSFQDLDWASYNRQFRLKASSTSTAQWGVVEATLWYLSRSGAEIGSTYLPA